MTTKKLWVSALGSEAETIIARLKIDLKECQGIVRQSGLIILKGAKSVARFRDNSIPSPAGPGKRTYRRGRPMKLMLIGFASILAAAFLSVEMASAVSPLKHLTGPIFYVEDPHFVATNYVIYVGRNSVTVVGATWTPGTAKALAQEISQVTIKPISEVIDTSPDPEWSGGNEYWRGTGAKIFAVRSTYDLLRNNWANTAGFIQQHPSDFASQQISLPTDVIPDRFELQQGNVQIMYLGPSHTPGDALVYFPTEKVLDAGSMIKEQLGNVASANLSEYPKTLQKLLNLHLDIRTVISGHWSAVHGPDLIDHYLDLLKEHDADHSQALGK